MNGIIPVDMFNPDILLYCRFRAYHERGVIRHHCGGHRKITLHYLIRAEDKLLGIRVKIRLNHNHFHIIARLFV